MIVKEIEAKTILSKSQIYDYALNAYVGCQHQCLYCYAKFMKRFTGHREPWGTFVDVKINAAELLQGQGGHGLVDRYNYHYADWAFKKHGMRQALDEDFLLEKGEELKAAFEKTGVTCRKLY